MKLSYQDAVQILKKSDVLYTEDELAMQIKKMSTQINHDIGENIPVFLTVMNGGMFFATELLKHITKPFVADYIHASRYGDATFGGTHITWYRQPKSDDVRDKIVYVIDDLLDEGHTLAEIKRFLNDAGAKECKLIVLIDKNINKQKPVQADYVGLSAPNKFLFGFGMDIHGLYRQLPNIYIYNQ